MAIIGGAVLEKYPNVRIALGESGIGWLPYALDRMDFEWEDRFTDLGLKMKPSEYWKRQCKATFQYDMIGARMVDDIGVETLMWGPTSRFRHQCHQPYVHRSCRTGRSPCIGVSSIRLVSFSVRDR